MPLGPDVAEWSALAAALAQLADRAGAANACVTDAWGHLWCRARAFSFPEQQRVLALARQLVEQAPAPLARGGRIDRSERTEHGAYAARSFAGVYVVLLLFDRPIDELAVRRAMRELLPPIEALTMALPPPDGPDATSGEGKRRA